MISEGKCVLTKQQLQLVCCNCCHYSTIDVDGSGFRLVMLSLSNYSHQPSSIIHLPSSIFHQSLAPIVVPDVVVLAVALDFD